jgi:hypothetical protein
MTRSPLTVMIQEHRLVFEQTFIDRAEFFNVERGVVDADGLARCLRMLIEAEGAQATEQHVIAQFALAR